MKLYEFARAPNPRRVGMFLAEKGVEIDRVPVDMMGGAHKTPDFLVKSPLAQLPVLELDDGTCLTESMAICRYVEALHPTPSLFGQTPDQIGVIDMWNRRAEFGVFLPAVMLLRHTSPILAQLQNQSAAAADAERSRLVERLNFFDTALAGRAFVAPTGFSIADITAFAGLDFTLHGEFEIPATLKNVQRWYAEVKARPSASV